MAETTAVPGIDGGFRPGGEGPTWPLWLVGSRVLTVILTAGALGWVALLNGQPLAHSGVAAAGFYQHLAADVGGIAAGPWLVVLLQGLSVALLVEITLRALRVESMGALVLVMAVIVLATPAPFLVGRLAPDIWLGAAIAAAAVLFALAGRLARLDLIALAAMVIFGALAHGAAPLVLAAIMLAGAALWAIHWRTAPDPRLGLSVCAAAVVIAIVSVATSGATVQDLLTMPPYANARAAFAGIAAQLTTADLPADALARLGGPVTHRGLWALKAVHLWQTAVLVGALLAATRMTAHCRQTMTIDEDENRSAAILLTFLVVVGVMSSSAVCALAPGLAGREPARVMWCLPLAAMALACVRPRGLRVVWRK